MYVTLDITFISSRTLLLTVSEHSSLSSIYQILDGYSIYNKNTPYQN